MNTKFIFDSRVMVRMFWTLEALGLSNDTRMWTKENMTLKLWRSYRGQYESMVP
jgi:hypothetical protein